MEGTMSQYLAVETEGKGTRVHRPTCKRAPERAVRVDASDLRIYARPIQAATCCKPKLNQPVTAGWADTPAPAVVLHDDPVRRIAAAKVESKILGHWQRSPRATRGPEPAHPNLDAIEAEADGQHTPTGAKATANGMAQRATRVGSERAALVNDTRKAAKNHRGPGRRLTFDELVAYVRQTRLDHPSESRHQGQEYAYWIDKIALSKTTWDKAWAATEPTT
jgi:hypothetical protein